MYYLCGNKNQKTMKKIILLALLVAGLSSCTRVAQRDELIIINVSDYGQIQSQEPYGRYKYEFKGNDLYLFTDSIYSVGDTLSIIKK